MEKRAKGPQEAEKMLYSIAKKSVPRREINKIKAKDYKKRRDGSNDSSSNKFYSDSSLSRHSDWDE